MGRNRVETTQLRVSISDQTHQYLLRLAKLGIHGTTAPEVAKTLISHEVERLIREGLLDLNKSNRESSR